MACGSVIASMYLAAVLMQVFHSRLVKIRSKLQSNQLTPHLCPSLFRDVSFCLFFQTVKPIFFTALNPGSFVLGIAMAVSWACYQASKLSKVPRPSSPMLGTGTKRSLSLRRGQREVKQLKPGTPASAWVSHRVGTKCRCEYPVWHESVHVLGCPQLFWDTAYTSPIANNFSLQ